MKQHIPTVNSLEDISCQPIALRIELRAAAQLKSQHSHPSAATRMKRCPVLLHLALITVALFADDVKLIAQLPLNGGVESSVAVQAETSTPLRAIRLVDAEGTLAEVARSGGANRDATAKPFSELPTPLNAVCAGMAANSSTLPPGASSLVSQHTRLQI